MVDRQLAQLCVRGTRFLALVIIVYLSLLLPILAVLPHLPLHFMHGSLGAIVVVPAALLLADCISGAVHFLLDHEDAGDRLRDEMPVNEAEEAKSLMSQKFAAASKWERFVWDFQIHHPFYSTGDNPLSGKAPKVTAWAQLFICLVATSLVGILCTAWAFWSSVSGSPPEPHRFATIVLSLMFASQVQRSHFWAHERNHSPETLPRVVRWAQDVGLLLHPEVHRIHHRTYNSHFSILNGWSNSFVQTWFRVLVRLSIVDDRLGMKPTQATGQEDHASSRLLEDGCYQVER